LIIGWVGLGCNWFGLFAPSVTSIASIVASIASISTAVVSTIASISTAVVSTIIAGTSVVSVPGISGSLGLGVSLGGGLGVGITLLAFGGSGRGNYGNSIAVKATVGMGITIDTCMVTVAISCDWVSIGDSGHGVGDSGCANSVSMGNSVVTGIGESIAISGCVRVVDAIAKSLRDSHGRAGGQDGGVGFGFSITLASVVSTISAISAVSTAIVSVPSISCGISLSLRGGLRLSQSQTGQ
jgi:hypothetical protein